MSCSRPIEVFVKSAGHAYLVPCGKCEECLQRKKMSFVHRIEQERLYGDYKYCYFVTLTYEDKYLPYESFITKSCGNPVSPVSTGEAVLNPYDLRLFLQKFRNFSNDSIKYFAAGEYGDPRKTHRPHFHIVLFTNLSWKKCVSTAELAWSYLVAETYEARKMRYKLSRKLGRPIKRDSRNMANRDLIGRVNVKSVTYKRICYVAKYVNKILFSNEIVRPFYRLSNGLGKCFLESDTARICRMTNRHYTYFENGLPVALSRYYTQRLFSAEQMEEYQLQCIEKLNPPSWIPLECDSDGRFHPALVAWYKNAAYTRKEKQRSLRMFNTGLLKFLS